jgi:uncharacterized protein (TIGR03067 family)
MWIAGCRYAIVAATLAVLAYAARTAGAQDASELEGTWSATSISRQGAVRTVKAGTMTFSFHGDVLRTKGLAGPGEITMHFVVDATAMPKRLDYDFRNRHTAAIYDVTGNTLRIAMPGPTRKRPTSLEAVS